MSYSNKIFLFGAFSIILALVFSYFLATKNLWMAEQAYLYFFLILALGSLFLALFALQTFLVENFLSGLILVFLESAALVSFSLQQINYWTIFAFAAVLLTFFQSFYSGRKNLANNLNLKINTNSRPIIKKALTGIILASVLLQTASFNFANLSISSSWLTTLKWPLETVGGFFIEDFSLDKSLGETLDQLARRSLPAELSNYPPETKNQLVQQAVNNLLQRAQQYIPINFDLKKSVIETIHQALNVEIKRIPSRFLPFIKIGLVIFIFLVLNSVSFLLVWLISLLTWFIFQLLLAAKFVKVNTKLKEAEKAGF